jgi:hypothetical protein
MKTLPLLVLSLWLALGMAPPAGAHLTLPHGLPDYPCKQPRGVDEPQDPDGYPIVATVTGINHQQGTLELDTADGRVSLAAAPVEIQDLQAGDQLLVCFEGDNIDGEDRLAALGHEDPLLL